jgi:hypothetical protein
MDLHQNARLTLRSRETLAIRVIDDEVTGNAGAAAFPPLCCAPTVPLTRSLLSSSVSS